MVVKLNRNEKKKVRVVNIRTGVENIEESRFLASKKTGIKRKAINVYIDKGIVFNKTYKYYNVENNE